MLCTCEANDVDEEKEKKRGLFRLLTVSTLVYSSSNLFSDSVKALILINYDDELGLDC